MDQRAQRNNTPATCRTIAPRINVGTNGGGNQNGNTSRGFISRRVYPEPSAQRSGDSAFTTVTQTASATPLPYTLGGVRFLIDDLEVPFSLSRRTKSTLRARQFERRFAPSAGDYTGRIGDLWRCAD